MFFDNIFWVYLRNFIDGVTFCYTPAGSTSPWQWVRRPTEICVARSIPFRVTSKKMTARKTRSKSNAIFPELAPRSVSVRPSTLLTDAVTGWDGRHRRNLVSQPHDTSKDKLRSLRRPADVRSSCENVRGAVWECLLGLGNILCLWRMEIWAITPQWESSFGTWI